MPWVKVLRDMAMNFFAGTLLTWTNMPAAETELPTSPRYRTKVDLTNYRQARMVVNVLTAGATTPAKLLVQYSTDETTWYYLDGSSGPSVNIDATGVKVGSWVNLTSGAKADVFLRIVGIDGDGVADPQFNEITVQFK